jgi:ppGpp synthetase/RelA/SpoT-type nucleotidyltranferase
LITDVNITEIREVGRALAKRITANDQYEYASAVEIFRLANSWRDSHIKPMRGVRTSVSYIIRKFRLKGLMASRLKRMESIRRKLRTSDIDYDKMNDLAGCRAILDDMKSVRILIEDIKTKFPHDIRREYNYIDNVKLDGYRSYHIIFNYLSRSTQFSMFDGRRVELQIRTRLQHSWATAVEAVSLFRGQDLKHGIGDEDWLHLFRLVSAEFAFVEGCQPLETAETRQKRVEEIRIIEKQIGAIQILEDIKSATSFAENYIFDRGRYFLIRYKSDHTVQVTSYDNIDIVTQDTNVIEREIELGKDDTKVVVVEVGKVDKLVETYPNYFGDVSLFVANLKRICMGLDAQEYVMLPQETVNRPKVHRGDPNDVRPKYRNWTHAQRQTKA